MIRTSVCEMFWSWCGARNRKRNRVAGAASVRENSASVWRRRRVMTPNSHATRASATIFHVILTKSCNLVKPSSMTSRPNQDLIYGPNAVLEALRAGKRQIEAITILESARPDRLKSLLDLAREKGVPVHRVPRLDLDRTLGDVRHQGVIARIASARYADADELLDQLETKIGTTDPPLVLGLDGVEDASNTGALRRSAEGAGRHGVFLGERRAVSMTSAVAKVAAGALEYVPVARVTNLVRLIEQLKERNIWVIGGAGG